MRVLDTVNEPVNDLLVVPELVAEDEVVYVPVRVGVNEGEGVNVGEAVYVAEREAEPVAEEVNVIEFDPLRLTLTDDDGDTDWHGMLTLLAIGASS